MAKNERVILSKEFVQILGTLWQRIKEVRMLKEFV